jgi:hypothetical protein
LKITSLLTYRDGAGNRRLRDYVKVTLGILILVVAVSAVGLHNRYEMVSTVLATPRPLDASFIPTPTEQISEPIVQVEECPSDPTKWTLTDDPLMPGNNLKGLAPQCVYDHLEKTAAWFYATYVLGHTRSESARAFGFSNIPMAYSLEDGQITVLTDFKDEPQTVNLRFLSDNNGLAEWRIDANGLPAVEFDFNGCFRTATLNGARVTTWGEGYPVVCQYSGDFQTRYLVNNVNGKVLTVSGTEDVRLFMWFGYAGDGQWVFLGLAKDWDVNLSQIPSHDTSTINPTVMAQKYGISSLPLPENRTTFTGQELVDAFLLELETSE